MQQATPSWKFEQQLGAGGFQILPAGGRAGTVTLIPTAGYKYLGFGFRFDQIVNFTIRYAVDTAAVFDVYTLAGVAGNWMTPYDLPAPIGDNGFVMVTAPYIRLFVNNPGGVATTVSRLWAYLCN